MHKFVYMQKCYNNCAYMHGYCSFAFNILLFFSLTFSSLSLFLSSTSLSPHSSCATDLRYSLATFMPPPIASLAKVLANCCCSRQSPLLSFFFVWWFWDFDQWFLMILISGFGTNPLSWTKRSKSSKRTRRHRLKSTRSWISKTLHEVIECPCILISGLWWFWLVVLGFW